MVLERAADRLADLSRRHAETLRDHARRQAAGAQFQHAAAAFGPEAVLCGHASAAHGWRANNPFVAAIAADIPAAIPMIVVLGAMDHRPSSEALTHDIDGAHGRPPARLPVK